MPRIEDFLTSQEEQQIVEAIRIAEKTTSGEIRVHLESQTSTEPLKRAVEVFHLLKMDTTAQRNGVLFYFAVQDKKFAIYGDEGINKLVPADFWESTKNQMKAYFQKGQFYQGIIEGILKAGEELKRYFPYQKEDINELPDDISKGEI
ncbi:TPM domain-containing protein [Capnocytophaga felis]|uniref:TPM domain-containing protein n=1 Tax=Capnocytophaga felis TaxID=2267611 RepID=A0A5M4B851_9FLAO|nr:TPM domain-containing protein [Capnocytophaga felis]GET45708.1 hypothetical protein RCZ01_10100 [Capnocytophaga felis]GET47932.1 hypothetical protein RCZ02_07630 [Capnocytophaga felis]